MADLYRFRAPRLEAQCNRREVYGRSAVDGSGNIAIYRGKSDTP